MEVFQKKMTYQEFRQIEFDETDEHWYELINGEIVKKQSPSFDHQDVSANIEAALRAYAKRTKSGKMYHAPLDVVLDDNNSYHPDVFFIKKERYFILDEKERIVIGAPDLVVEILSKSTAPLDRGSKKDNYEKHGVREYWIVNPAMKSVEVYTYENQRYALRGYFEGDGILKSFVLEGFEMDVEEIFEE